MRCEKKTFFPVHTEFKIRRERGKCFFLGEFQRQRDDRRAGQADAEFSVL